MFQVMQGVIVTNEALEHHGQAGYVTKAVDEYDKTSKVLVRMDSDNEEYEFDQTDIRAL
ncbi:hypothetical protein GTP23_12080 [Pseudoduganella sp. FT93W]|uniref:Uncharacterized protein n=1 Tax=Duganella fentianensis TaxID=2692177 RepID=A0A845I1Y0_9BURK|nr:hypothetical protein [Duganella fentianensis]MYN45785.1 hypothetical protein [Duganella fentianensis]